jgi:Tfp pilus assembly protein PilX
MRMNSLSRQHGFTMVAVMVTMLVTGLLGIAAFASVNGDLPFSRDSKDRKLAYGAAEAGLNYYLFQLNRDFDYWSKCTSGPPPSATEANPVNQNWNGAGTDPRNFRKVQGGKAEYALEMMPANGFTQCIVNNGPSVIDQASSTFSLRTTGRSGEVKRSVGATLRRKSFLDYLYFTDFETLDPKAYAAPADQADAATYCGQPRAGRDASPFSCSNIIFQDADAVNGPLHTNDDLLTCGTPEFGRNVNDRIEVVGPLPGIKASGGSCPAGSPVMNGTFQAGAQAMLMPLTAQPLAARADPNYLYTGKTTIVLNGANMTVTNAGVNGGSPKTLPLPANGVIYVKQSSCSYSVAPLIADYAEPASCATLYVKGTYSSSLTIASQNDVIINGDITSSNDAIAGIIADNFVRVYHPVTRSSGSCVANVQAPRDFRIDSALVSLMHSFIVDNWNCGAHLGTLTVNGAIAQKFRGPVGIVGSTSPGYLKNYQYDDRFRYRSPPYFVEPVAAAWRVLRTNEQVPAR